MKLLIRFWKLIRAAHTVTSPIIQASWSLNSSVLTMSRPQRERQLLFTERILPGCLGAPEPVPPSKRLISRDLKPSATDSARKKRDRLSSHPFPQEWGIRPSSLKESPNPTSIRLFLRASHIPLTSWTE